MELIEAIEEGDTEAVKQHIAAGADVNAKDEGGSTGLGMGSTPLHIAAWEGYNEIVELLLANGADVNAKDEEGLTPLHNAAGEDYKEIAELLIANGADVNAKNEAGETPLDRAEDWPETADLLRKNSGNSGEKSTVEKTIHGTVISGNIEAVKQHLTAGVDVNTLDDRGRTPLHHAAGVPDLPLSHKEIIELLIAKGADVNVKDSGGETPLDLAYDETFDLLSEHGGKTGEELKAEGK